MGATSCSSCSEVKVSPCPAGAAPAVFCSSFPCPYACEGACEAGVLAGSCGTRTGAASHTSASETFIDASTGTCERECRGQRGYGTGKAAQGHSGMLARKHGQLRSCPSSVPSPASEELEHVPLASLFRPSDPDRGPALQDE